MDHTNSLRWWSTLWRWLSNDEALFDGMSDAEMARVDWPRAIPFALIHIACFGVIWVGFSWVALAVALSLYLIRMFVITGFYHRYFSHRAFKVSRPLQFLMAVIGCSAGQRGPLWWAGHHRDHHATSDTDSDPHSPSKKGFWISHTLWFLKRGNFPLRSERVRDWLRVPELFWLDKFDWIPFVGLGFLCYALGAWMEQAYPGAGTNGWQMLVWGFFISTVVLYHATYTINSVAHGFGSRRYDTPDDSRNNAWLAVITLGEGWHNNHHHYPAAARQGFYWWEIDICYGILCVMRSLGLAHSLRPVPEDIRAARGPAKRPQP